MPFTPYNPTSAPQQQDPVTKGFQPYDPSTGTFGSVPPSVAPQNPPEQPANNGIFSTLAHYGKKIVSEVGGDIANVWNQGRGFYSDIASGEKAAGQKFGEDIRSINPGQDTGTQITAGTNLAGDIGDAIMVPFNSFLKHTGISDAVSASAKNIVDAYAKTPGANPQLIQEGLGNLMKGAGDAFNAFAEAHPNEAQVVKNVGRVLNPAMLVETGGEAKAAAPALADTATDMAAKTGQAIDVAKSAVSDTAPKIASATKESVVGVADKNIEQSYRKLLNMTGKQKELEAEWGKNTPSILAKEQVPLPLDEKGAINTEPARAALQLKVKAMNDAMAGLVADTGQYHSLDELAANAKAGLTRLKGRGTDFQAANDYIDQQLAAWKENFKGAAHTGANGETIVPTSVINEIKDGGWKKSLSTKYPERNAALLGDADFQIGQSGKGIIERDVKDADIQAMNQKIGDYQQALKTLKLRNGMMPQTGKLSKIVSMTASGSMGATLGGPAGAALGLYGGKVLGDLAASQTLPLSFWGKIRETLAGGAQAADKAMLEKIDNIMQQRSAERAARPRLEAPKSMPMGPSANTSGVASQSEAIQSLRDLGYKGSLTKEEMDVLNAATRDKNLKDILSK